MKKGIGFKVVLTASIGFGSTFGLAGEAFASKLSDLESRQNQIENKQSNVEQNINEKSKKITELQSEQAKLSAEIKQLDQSITKAEKQIREKQTAIANTKKEIEKLRKEIEELKARIAERNLILQERARSLQQSGGSASYIDVLLGSESFTDFINRASAVTTLVKADKDILQEQEKDKKQLEKNEKAVKAKLANLESMLADLKELKAGLDKKKAAKDQVMDQLANEEDHAHNQKLSLEEEKELLASQEKAIQAAITSEQSRLAKEEEARKEQARLARQKEQQPAAGQRESSRQPAAAPQEESVTESRSNDTPAVSAGSFMRPAQGHVSSGFGARSLGDHKGIDIANSVSVPIVAAADGEVIRSYYSSSYGNCILISHSINGKVFTTVYAHMSERVVQGGSVSKGQVIGYMGNTGRSFGQHLHFEVHEGPWTLSKENAVDPRKYVNF
ncbi:murein hydrolase activator EnvC family protein [Bacillus badius]|uniref:Peptidoglycan lytic protein P45 n=1 Tax=Bacillus badius TaxID=1455 RepID=A0ABR5AWT0_BACBA|nr:M23 family metallopeptidase [Bacillus badius]KIL76246.1 peptidoglycan lytic protein P45 [Bacillus badius]KIL79190.1 peptidoglycan lytic protein P45 [Bacillus badius]MED4714784.1 peptidoglycan DD-metalloendopeptidase family protein [Bacillus badius]